MKCHSLRAALVAVGLVSFSALAQGAPTVFFARDNSTGSMPNSQAQFNHFTNALNSYGVEDAELIDSGPPAFGVNPTLTFGLTGITAASQGVLAQSAPGFQIDDQALLELDAAIPGQFNTVFTFNQHITAFGLFVIQGGDSGLPNAPAVNDNPTTFRLKDTVANTSVDVLVQIGPDWTFQNIFFLGLADSIPFNEVEIIETGDVSDGMLYDNLVAGFVPEPGSLALLMIGGACTLGRRYRRG